MRNATRGLITVCAGLVAGAAFGATPALAGPTWVPPGHVLGYYGSPGSCSSYASSLVLWEDDYDCDYRPHRVAMPYALVIQRPVLIAQPVLGIDDSDDYRQPVAPAPDMQQPAAPAPDMQQPPATDPAPAPVVREPSGSAQSEKPAKDKSHKKKHKSNKAIKGNAMADESPAAATTGGGDCPTVATVASTCTDVLAVPTAVTPVIVAPVQPLVQVVHHRPHFEPWHHPWPL